MPSNKLIQKNKKASVLVVTLILMGIIVSSAISIAFVSLKERKASIGASKSSTAYQMAETGVEMVLKQMLKSSSAPVYTNELTGCRTSPPNQGLIVIDNPPTGSYRVQLQDSNGDPIACDSGTTLVSSVRKLRALGIVGQNNRAVQVGIPSKSGDTTPPDSVVITAPSAGPVSGSVTITATATDNVGGSGIAGVQFKVDGLNIGTEDNTAPYSTTWNTTGYSNGSHTLTAVARDVANNTKTSSVITVTVNNVTDSTPPVRSAGSPSGNLPAGTTSTTISLTTDENATCKYSTTAGTAYASMTNTFTTTGLMSHSTSVSGLSNGITYNYYVRCIDTATTPNPNTTDYPITFTVSNADATPPTVALSAPANGATVSGASTTVSATASDNVGVVGVQFKLDGANLNAEDITSPYSITWNTTATTNGSHVLTAVARDAAGNQATSSARTVTVSNAGSANLVGHWKFNEVSGTAAADSSGSGNGGTLVNGPTWTTGQLNGALNFDGTNDYVNLGNQNASMRFTGNGTVSSWVKLNSTFANYGMLFIKQTDSNNAGYWQWGIMTYINSNRTVGICIVHEDGGAHSHCVDSATVLTRDTWYHITTVWESPNIKIYINGNTTPDITTNVGTGTLRTGASGASYIGAIYNETDVIQSFFKGALDDVRIFDGALTATQVQTLYNAR